jgi:hypothetical protein
MIKLPKFLRMLKFDSQEKLVSMISGAINGFILSCEDSEFTDKKAERLEALQNDLSVSNEEYGAYFDGYMNDYRNYILSRYVNIMPNYVGVTGTPLNDAIFIFQIGQIKTADQLFLNQTKTITYGAIRSELLRDFLPKNCPGFNSIKEN